MRREMRVENLRRGSRVEDGEEMFDERVVDGVFHEFFMGGDGVPIFRREHRDVSILAPLSGGNLYMGNR